MAICVTGGAGFIGSHTVVELLQENQEVIIIDDFSNSKPLVLDRIEAITGKRPILYKINCLDKEKLLDVFKKNPIDACIHFAAFKAVGESVSKPLAYYHNNIESLLSLISVMQETKVKKLVFSSSATVYGQHNVSPLTEDLPVSATNPYGYTKVFNEQIIRDVVKADPTFKAVILRYFNPIGAHPSGLIGEDPQGIPNNLMPYITQVAIGTLKQLSIFGNDYPTHDGTGVRDYIHVVDLAMGHLAALNYLKDHQGVFTFNLGTGQGVSVLDLVHSFIKVNGVDIPYQMVDRRPGDVATCYANADKALKELGWKTQLTLSDMVKDSWNWQVKNPHGLNNTQGDNE